MTRSRSPRPRATCTCSTSRSGERLNDASRSSRRTLVSDRPRRGRVVGPPAPRFSASAPRYAGARCPTHSASPRARSTRHCSTCRGDAARASGRASTIVVPPQGHLAPPRALRATSSGHVVAIKETTEPRWPGASTTCSRNLQRLDVPCVEPRRRHHRTGRMPTGEPLPPALVTAHLKFSLPYRALFSQVLRPDTATRLVDALAVLLVRLHIVGFFWGDVSLSNTLFRRDAGAFAAYLVDAETGELTRAACSHGQRENDLEIARMNIAGEIIDLEAGGRLEGERRRRSRSPTASSSSYRIAVDGAHRLRGVRRRRALAHQPSACSASTTSASTSARWRSSTDDDGTRVSHPAEGRGCRAPPAPPAPAHRPRRRGEPGAPPAQRPRRVPRRISRIGDSTRRWSRTSG